MKKVSSFIVFAGLLAAGAPSAFAQAYQNNTMSSDVYVNWRALENLGPAPTIPGLIRGREYQSPPLQQHQSSPYGRSRSPSYAQPRPQPQRSYLPDNYARGGYDNGNYPPDFDPESYVDPRAVRQVQRPSAVQPATAPDQMPQSSILAEQPDQSSRTPDRQPVASRAPEPLTEPPVEETRSEPMKKAEVRPVQEEEVTQSTEEIQPTKEELTRPPQATSRMISRREEEAVTSTSAAQSSSRTRTGSVSERVINSNGLFGSIETEEEQPETTVSRSASESAPQPEEVSPPEEQDVAVVFDDRDLPVAPKSKQQTEPQDVEEEAEAERPTQQTETETQTQTISETDEAPEVETTTASQEETTATAGVGDESTGESRSLFSRVTSFLGFGDEETETVQESELAAEDQGQESADTAVETETAATSPESGMEDEDLFFNFDAFEEDGADESDATAGQQTDGSVTIAFDEEGRAREVKTDPAESEEGVEGQRRNIKSVPYLPAEEDSAPHAGQTDEEAPAKQRSAIEELFASITDRDVSSDTFEAEQESTDQTAAEQDTSGQVRTEAVEEITQTSQEATGNVEARMDDVESRLDEKAAEAEETVSEEVDETALQTAQTEREQSTEKDESATQSSDNVQARPVEDKQQAEEQKPAQKTVEQEQLAPVPITQEPVPESDGQQRVAEEEQVDVASIPPTDQEITLPQERRVLFETGDDDLPATATDVLDEVVQEIRNTPGVRAQLYAYASGGDDTASQAQARRISLARALAIRAYLVDQGIPTTRLDVRALGTKSEEGPGDRVDIIFVRR